ncbi:DegT/DnrJ/EryC1/StrS family aminotransferase [Sediminivirga luteola]|uniref:DegT/DnrJ/EryC1/StrS family aminotransferase n=1 Tax=Sediminivirga luteola TaxID=1774748 RepID=UPI001F5A70E7|nr:aminotransferase class I/II-fold pyridoxal phosphate-dependent enzyme [Sediminivirga luteola]MCI2266952.1 aminotransferase class I/II-fold pyridoxal phosphate-dependent enzyme [Sediminivirga luteola]
MNAERIYLSSPDVGELEEQHVLNAIKSGWVAPIGPDVNAFEDELAARIGVHHAVALSSGTAALHLALLGIGVKPGDVVLTSTMTFAATANAIVYTGAEPFFVDSDPVTGNISPELLEAALTDLRAAGERVAAVVPVDLLGKAADYTALEDITARFEVPLVADAAEALGATHRGRPAGSFGDASVLSFNGNKIMTTSGGGALLTNDERLAERARYLATQARQPVAHYEHVDIGYNYRLSNLLAALGRAQLQRLDEMIARRRELRERYKEVFGAVEGASVFGADGDEHDNVWLTAVLVNPEKTGWTAGELSEALAARNIESRPLWKPMHLQPVFAGSRSKVDGSSESLFRTGLTLPSGSALTAEQHDRVFGAIKEFLAV